VRATGRRGAGAPPAEARLQTEVVRAAGRRGAGARRPRRADELRRPAIGQQEAECDDQEQGADAPGGPESLAEKCYARIVAVSGSSKVVTPATDAGTRRSPTV